MSERYVVVPALVVSAVAAVLFGAFLSRDRQLVAATPSPRPLFDVSLVNVMAGERLCISDVTIPPEAQELRFQVGTFRRLGPALVVTLEAPRYRERVSVDAGYADNAVLALAVEPPDVASLGTVCIRNRGPRVIALTATEEVHTLSRPYGRRGARVVPADAYLAFYEQGAGSALDRATEIVERMSAFRPGLVGPWLLWPLAVLVMVGIPLGVVCALLAAARR